MEQSEEGAKNSISVYVEAKRKGKHTKENKHSKEKQRKKPKQNKNNTLKNAQIHSHTFYDNIMAMLYNCFY